MAFLPGNLRLRVKELRTQHNMTQEELASILGVDKGTVSRLEKEPEKGEEKSPKVSCDLLIKLAEYFHVSADFLLGITNVSDPVNQPAEMLGLTEGAAKAMLSRSVYMGILNRLLENPQFGQLTYTMYYATEPNQTAGIMTRNNLLAYTDSIFVESMNKSIRGNQQIMGLNRKLGAELIDPYTIGNHQIEDEFRKIVSQLRRDVLRENPVSVPLTREFLAEMDAELLKRADGERKNINPRIVAEVMTDKSMVASICTPEQRARFIDLMTDILTAYGGETVGKEKEPAPAK